MNALVCVCVWTLLRHAFLHENENTRFRKALLDVVFEEMQFFMKIVCLLSAGRVLFIYGNEFFPTEENYFTWEKISFTMLQS